MASLGCTKLWAFAAAVVVLSAVGVGPCLSYNLHEGLAKSIARKQEAATRSQQAELERDIPKDVGSEIEAAVKLDMPLGEGPSFRLVHIDHHPESPFLRAEFSLADKIKNGVRRSQKRVSLISRIISPDFSTDRAVMFDESNEVSNRVAASYEEPLAASPGSYVMTISLGTPPQTKTAIADTGSDLNWVQALPCTSCYPQSDPIFAPNKSSTYRRTAYSNALCSALPSQSNTGGFCTYSYAYGDQSTTRGDLAFDTITLTTTSGSKVPVPNFCFGAGHNNRGTFSGTDGLVGLGQGPLSFPLQLGSLFSNKFSYCLVSISSAASTTSPIVFGDDSASSRLNLQYTPIVRNTVNPTFYYVTLNDISVGGRALNLPASTFAIRSSGSGGVILDSGTTITQLIQAAYTPLLTRLRSLIRYPTVSSTGIGLDLCYDTSAVTNPSFPTIVLRFAGVDVSLPADNSFVLVDEQGTVCLAFAGTSQFTIIGNIQQQNYYYLYDRQNQRVGIAPADCDSLGSSTRAQSQ